MQAVADLASQFLPLMLSALATYLVAVSVPFVIAHLKIKNAQAQQLVTSLLTGVIQRGQVFAESEIKTALVPRIAQASTGNEKVDKVIDYVAAQSPDLLKKVGVDVTTATGQHALARRIVATLPAPGVSIST